jgi:hypothetical protein
MRLILALILSTIIIAAASAIGGTKYPIPGKPHGMELYTPEGYTTKWWITLHKDDCNLDYSILNPKNELVAHGRMPCQLMFMFFHSAQLEEDA